MNTNEISNDVAQNTTEANDPHGARLDRLESLMEGVAAVVDTLRPVASVIPGGAVAATVIGAVAHGADAIIDTLQGEGVDPAALAAGMIGHSTGDTSLDARLAQIEAFIAALLPVLAYLGKEFGLQVPTAFTAQGAIANKEGA